MITPINPILSEWNIRKKERGDIHMHATEMFYCEKCKCVWEKISKCLSNKQRKGYCIYAKGILPTIGKIRKPCPEC